VRYKLWPLVAFQNSVSCMSSKSRTSEIDGLVPSTLLANGGGTVDCARSHVHCVPKMYCHNSDIRELIVKFLARMLLRK